VSSTAEGAVTGSANLDLSQAGPADSGGCTTGTGADFAVVGSTPSFPSWLTPVGATEHYVQPAAQPTAPLSDPFHSIVEPSLTSLNLNQVTGIISGPGTLAGQGDCPGFAGIAGCTIYPPGYYSGGISATNVGIFYHGFYYMDGAQGFSITPTGDAIMCSTTCANYPNDTSGCCANGGMFVYVSANAGSSSVLNLTAHNGTSLLGSSITSPYMGVLLYVARAAVDRHNGNLSGSGGAVLSLQGTIYAPTQTLTVSGPMTLWGGVVTKDLVLNGSSAINLGPSATYLQPVDQVALVK
jgi:hypothetical protein